MGFLKNILGGDKEEKPDVDVDNEFESGVEYDEENDLDGQPVEEEFEEEEPEDEALEWESAYDFAGWYLEDEGFASMRDFGEKAMMMKLERSPMYRDRIQSGMETLGMIRSAKEQMREIKGKKNTDSDYGEMADKLEDANRVIQNVRSLSGEDEMVVQQGMNLARDAIGAIANKTSGSSANVGGGVERTGGDI